MCVCVCVLHIMPMQSQEKPQNVDDYLSTQISTIFVSLEYNQLSEILDILAPLTFRIIHKVSAAF